MSGVSMDDLYGGFDMEGGGLFGPFFGSRRRRGPARGQHVEVRISVPLERIAAGGEEKVHVAHPRTCDACHGTGAKAGCSPRPCSACGGKGQHVVARQEKNVMVRQISTCSVCGGKGTAIDEPCTTCAGTGSIAATEELSVKVPVGAEEGMLLRIAGRGLPSPDPGGPPGDLLIAVHAAADERFVRRGPDLYRSQDLSVPDAVLGTTISVPALGGQVTAKVPRGSQPGAILRLRHKGLPRFGGGGRGDLFVELNVRVPERVSPEEEALYARLRDLSHSSEARTASAHGEAPP